MALYIKKDEFSVQEISNEKFIELDENYSGYQDFQIDKTKYIFYDEIINIDELKNYINNNFLSFSQINKDLLDKFKKGARYKDEKSKESKIGLDFLSNKPNKSNKSNKPKKSIMDFIIQERIKSDDTDIYLYFEEKKEYIKMMKTKNGKYVRYSSVELEYIISTFYFLNKDSKVIHNKNIVFSFLKKLYKNKIMISQLQETYDRLILENNLYSFLNKEKSNYILSLDNLDKDVDYQAIKYDKTKIKIGNIKRTKSHIYKLEKYNQKKTKIKMKIKQTKKDRITNDLFNYIQNYIIKNGLKPSQRQIERGTGHHHSVIKKYIENDENIKNLFK